MGWAWYFCCWGAGAQTASPAACTNNICNTVQDQALTLSQSDVGAPAVYDFATFSQGTVGSSVELNGARLVTPTPICAQNGGNVTPAQIDAGSVDEFSGWTITAINPANTDPAIQYAYGGMTFNSGDTTPNGIASQTFATAASATYTGSLRTTYGGSLTGKLGANNKPLDSSLLAFSDYYTACDLWHNSKS